MLGMTRPDQSTVFSVRGVTKLYQMGEVEVKALRENLMALLADIRKARPPQAKGQYLKRLTVSSTMGPGVGIDQATIEGEQA